MCVYGYNCIVVYNRPKQCWKFVLLKQKNKKKKHPAYYVDDGISRMGVHLLNITNHNCKIIINLQLWNSYRKTFTKTTA